MIFFQLIHGAGFAEIAFTTQEPLEGFLMTDVTENKKMTYVQIHALGYRSLRWSFCFALFVVFYNQLAPNGAFRTRAGFRSTVRCELFVVVPHDEIFKLR
jgi:hypothetical protein